VDMERYCSASRAGGRSEVSDRRYQISDIGYQEEE
jgi:hypothetical protein